MKQRTLTLTMLAVAGHASAQCSLMWLPPVPGFDGPVRAAVVWDPDGDGPAGPVLVLAGSFGSAGGIPARNIAYWDGAGLGSIGLGVSEPVSSLAVYRGDLIAVMETCNVARWNGVAWENLGQSFCTVPFGPGAYLSTAQVHEGELFLGGRLPPAEPGCCTYAMFARLDGEAWGLLPPPSGSENAWISVLGEYNRTLIGGGGFDPSPSGIGLWNGAGWEPLGEGLYGEVASLTTYGGRLIAGGTFWLAGGLPASCIAAWDGSAWSPLGSGVDGWLDPQTPPAVKCLAVHGSDLIAAGAFRTAGGIPCNSIARWDGAAWSPMESGIEGQAATLASFGEDLFVGGAFGAAGGQGAMNVARLRCACYANCDGSTVAPTVNVLDFACFLNRFAAGESDAQLDGSAVPPILGRNDFVCFLVAFAAGCS